MNIGEGMAIELEHEGAATRRMLEAAPEQQYDWRPHEKSFTLGALVTHLANLLRWGLDTVQADVYDLPADFREPAETSRTALLVRYDEGLAQLLAALRGLDNAAMMTPWTLRREGEVLFQMPRAVVLRSMILNHLVHHRGQLSVYLRLLEVPVPQVYGPTADFPQVMGNG